MNALSRLSNGLGGLQEDDAGDPKGPPLPAGRHRAELTSARGIGACRTLRGLARVGESRPARQGRKGLDHKVLQHDPYG